MKSLKVASVRIRFNFKMFRKPKVHHKSLTPGPLQSTVSRDWVSGVKGSLLSRGIIRRK